MKIIKKAGATSEIWQIFIADSSSTTGAGLTGLLFNTASLTAYYHRDTDTTATVMTLVTMTVGTFTSLGFKEIDATNMPGWYQLCPPNAALASGAKSCGFHLKGATNMAPLPLEVQLTAVDPDSATAFLTSVATVTTLTNAPSDSSGITTLLSRIASALTLSAGAVTVGTNNDKTGYTASTVSDKTGYSLSTGGVQAIWDALTSALSTVGSIGKLLVTNIDALISSRGTSTYAGTDTSGTTTLLSRIASALTITGGAVNVNDKTGFSISGTKTTLDALQDISQANVLTQINSALDAAGTELAAIPTTTSSLRLKINFLFQYFRNKRTITATTETLFKEDSSTTLGTSALTDNGTTFTKAKTS